MAKTGSGALQGSGERPSRVVVIGASTLGCEFALAAQAAGLAVTLVDEHPQSMADMAFDAPNFYGLRLPASLAQGSAALADLVSSNERLMACMEAGVDLKLGAVAWGIFQNGPNAAHVGPSQVAVASRIEGGGFLEYDHLVIAAGSRDFVPSFRKWELSGVIGVNAAVQLLDAYQSYPGVRTLILGSSEPAIELARKLRPQGSEVAGIVEPGPALRCDDATAASLASDGVPLFINRVIGEATGKQEVTGATLVSTRTGEATESVACDTICIGIASLPNVELPASLGCDMFFSDALATWLPKVSDGMETSAENVFWLSKHSGGPEQVQAALDAILRGSPHKSVKERVNPNDRSCEGTSIRTWVDQLDKHGGADITLCQCESVTRADFLRMNPPSYLEAGMCRPRSPLVRGRDDHVINQDQLKRSTRAGMGHCQGRRCRDEASLLLEKHFGVPLQNIRPPSFRFPVRPVDIAMVVAEDIPGQHWSYWVGSSE